MRAVKFLGFKVLGEAGVRFISIAFILLLARHLGADAFGRYSSAYAFAALFTILVDLGSNHIVTREIARHPARRRLTVNTTNLLKIAAYAAAWILLHFSARYFDIARDKTALIDALGIVVLGQALTDHYAALLSGKEEMGWEAFLKVSARFLTLAGAWAALALDYPLAVIVQWMAVGTVAAYAASALITRARFGVFGYAFDGALARDLARGSLPVFYSVVFLLIYEHQDILILNYFRVADRDIGLFSAALKIVVVLRVFPILLAGAFYPSLSRLAHEPGTAFAPHARALVGRMALGGAVLAFAAVFAAEPLIRLLFGRPYAGAASLLQTLQPALLMAAVNQALLQLIIARDHERKLTAAALVACLSKFGFCWFLVPRWGAAGACYALIGSELFFLVSLGRIAARIIPGLFRLAR